MRRPTPIALNRRVRVLAGRERQHRRIRVVGQELPEVRVARDRSAAGRRRSTPRCSPARSRHGWSDPLTRRVRSAESRPARARPCAARAAACSQPASCRCKPGAPVQIASRSISLSARIVSVLPRLRIVNVVSLKLLFVRSPVWNEFLAISTAPVSIVESASGSPPCAPSPSGALDSTALDSTLFDSALLESAAFDSTTLDSTALVSALFVSIALDSALFGSRFDRTDVGQRVVRKHRVGQRDVRRVEIGQRGIERVVRQDDVRQHRVGQRVVRQHRVGQHHIRTARRWSAQLFDSGSFDSAAFAGSRLESTTLDSTTFDSTALVSALFDSALFVNTLFDSALLVRTAFDSTTLPTLSIAVSASGPVPSPFFTSGAFASGLSSTCVSERVVRRVRWRTARRDGSAGRPSSGPAPSPWRFRCPTSPRPRAPLTTSAGRRRRPA